MILIVDDDPSVTTSLGLLLKQNGYAFRGASTPDEALALLSDQEFDLTLQDMNFSRSTTGEEGLKLLNRVREVRSDLPVILITAWGSISLAVEGMKAGASDFITKPWSNQQLLQSVETALSLADARSTGATRAPLTRQELDKNYKFGDLLGHHPRLLKLLDLVAGLLRPCGCNSPPLRPVR